MLEYQLQTSRTLMRMLLNSFHLNGPTRGFHPRTQKEDVYFLEELNFCRSSYVLFSKKLFTKRQ